ncbi:SCP2 sterol-binding domain-containing protein [Pseudahrensia aquimaris]|uniref:SCP2 sterol-binding domain-containing protein n=1 Tax=Pseudahrensia aquimaris TaxID=744461 RepID=A0ABW3FJ57_9HYPH
MDQPAKQMQDPTIQQIIDAMPERFDPHAADGVDAVLQFNLTGEEARNFYAIIKDGACTLKIGQHGSPTMSMKMSAQTYVDMVMGRITGQEAFFRRKLTYRGPINLAIRIHRFFRPPETAASA